MESPSRVLLSLTSWNKDIPLSDKDDVFIGRNEICQHVINLPHISSKHLRLVVTEQGTFCQDHSTNGTFLNGEKMDKLRMVPLLNGHKLSLTPPGEFSVESISYVFRDCSTLATPQYSLESLFITKPPTHVDIVKKLGKGAFGDVFLGVLNHRLVAIKSVPKHKINASKLFDEVKVMHSLRFPHIVEILKVWDDNNKVVMFLQYAAGGDLEALIKTLGPLSESDAKSMLVQILHALVYLHENKVIHRDLKPENILILDALHSGGVPHLLLSDFGLSKMMDETIGDSGVLRAITVCGTPHYIAPEIIQLNQQKQKCESYEAYDERVDLWSTGVVLYRLVHGKLPWTRSHADLYHEIIRAGNPHTPVKTDKHISVPCRQFIEKLVVNAPHRLFAKEAQQHEWIAGERNLLAVPPSLDEATQGFDYDDDDDDDEEEEEFPSAKRMRS